MKEEFEEPNFGYFILIKDSITEEAEILNFSDNHYDLIDKLESLIKKENSLIKEENEIPPSVMQRKHSKDRTFKPFFKPEETKREKEIIRFSNGRIKYRIEEL